MSGIGQPWGRLQPPHAGPVSIRVSRHDPPGGEPPRLAWGNGRSYGDVCRNSAGTLVDGRGADRILEFDGIRGSVICESGLLLRDLQAWLLGHGLWLPVAPGTELITVGGAIANDVHGKNHHRAGSFGHHVRGFELLHGDGRRTWCMPGDDLFRATVGGLGLTGIVTQVELAVERLAGSGWLSERARRTGDLAATLETLARVDTAHTHTAAWLDCLARGPRLGRGVVFAADPADGEGAPPQPGRGPRVPFAPPVSPVRPLTLRAFNALYYHGRRADSGWCLRTYRQVLHPLDGIADWNRLYGRAGFAQCQVRVPEQDHAAVLGELIGRAAREREGSFLVVLKRLGAREPAGMMSFARAGYTLALDFPWRGERTRELVRTLYDIALDAGGGIYPAKDAVMTPAQFRRAFPQADEFAGWIDPACDSDFARRVELTCPDIR